MSKYRIIIIDDNEDSQIIHTDCREKAMEIANRNKYATIYSV